MSNVIGTRQHALEDLETVRFIASALFDVSAEKIGRLRTAFEKNKEFYDDISRLYQSIKQTAFERGELPKKTSSVEKTLSVAFTSNTRFYGSVNTEIMLSFVEYMHSGSMSDYLVIGRTGKAFIENNPDTKASHCMFYAFTEDEPTSEEIRAFLQHVEPYDQIQLFYPSFVNVFTQKVVMKDVTYAPHEPTAGGHTSAKFDYIFEPELPKILDFFETKVRYLLVQRAMLESELARTAARLFSMNQAQERSDVAAAHLRHVIRKDKANFSDSRLLESFSAIPKWNK